MTVRVPIRSLSKVCLVAMALGLLVCGPGCAPHAYRSETHTDDDGTVVTRMIGGEMGLYRPEMFGYSRNRPGVYAPSAMCGLDAQRCQDFDGGVTCQLLLTIRSVDGGTVGRYLDTSTAVTLSLAIDEWDVLLSPENDQLSQHGSNTWSYPLSFDVLSKLAEAHEIDVTLSNDGGSLIGVHGGRFFKQFFDECVIPAGESAKPKQ